ncbi:glutamate--tRNA ligase [Desulfococcaceae bacterium OttesenSCG-928-F15]|nr:glutamate--tRNA ligase [Desulfococcaceae bacterium OttesenSCG-928-F15]
MLGKQVQCIFAPILRRGHPYAHASFHPWSKAPERAFFGQERQHPTTQRIEATVTQTIITRFPPSPTGYLHVGGARTALFNWLFARKTHGKFILRIEDTDTQRSTKESVDAIFDGLNWLELDWDEGPFFQTQRFDIYKKYLEKLIQDKKAYYCTCSPEAVEAMREKARAEGRNPMYDGTCRCRNLGPEKGAVVRLKTPDTGSTRINDLVKGSISIPNTEIDDFILCRSDGVYTYNFAVVIDDLTMNVSHVIRGDDHISNTPKQILIYEALGAPLPQFGHVPMVLGPDKTRLSKRHGAMGVMEYKKMGFLPEALLNYLVRLGWSHGDQEFFTIEDMKELFTIEAIGRSPGVFDLDKLTALNAEHIQKSTVERLRGPFLEEMAEKKIPHDPEDAKIDAVIHLLQPRSKTIVDMVFQAEPYFMAPTSYCEIASKKNFKADSAETLRKIREKLLIQEDFSPEALEAMLQGVCDEMNIKFGKVGGPLRVALTGRGQTPGMAETLAVIGKDASIPRIDAAIRHLEEKFPKQG